VTVEEDVSRIKVKFLIEGLGEAEGELVRFLAPRTVETIVRKLPVEGRAALWKEEVYFEIPLKMGEEKAKPTGRTSVLPWVAPFPFPRHQPQPRAYWENR
jgi:hypothetical protein